MLRASSSLRNSARRSAGRVACRRYAHGHEEPLDPAESMFKPVYYKYAAGVLVFGGVYAADQGYKNSHAGKSFVNGIIETLSPPAGAQKSRSLEVTKVQVQQQQNLSRLRDKPALPTPGERRIYTYRANHDIPIGSTINSRVGWKNDTSNLPPRRERLPAFVDN